MKNLDFLSYFHTLWRSSILISSLLFNGRQIDFSIVYPKSTFFHQYLILNQTPWSIPGILLIWLKNSKLWYIWASCPLLKKSCQGFVVPWSLLLSINNKKIEIGFLIELMLSIEASSSLFFQFVPFLYWEQVRHVSSFFFLLKKVTFVKKGISDHTSTFCYCWK